MYKTYVIYNHLLVNISIGHLEESTRNCTHETHTRWEGHAASTWERKRETINKVFRVFSLMIISSQHHHCWTLTTTTAIAIQWTESQDVIVISNHPMYTVPPHQLQEKQACRQTQLRQVPCLASYTTCWTCHNSGTGVRPWRGVYRH